MQRAWSCIVRSRSRWSSSSSTNPTSIEHDGGAEQDVARSSRRTAPPCSSGLMTYMTAPRPSGRMPRTMALILPSAVSAATSRRRRSRCVIVSATVIRSSARLPPTSRWMRMAMTAQAKSGLSMRVGDAVERLLERPAEAGLGDHPAQLLAHRLGDLLGHGLDALHERVAGPERAGRAAGACRAAGAMNCLAPPVGQEVHDRRREQGDEDQPMTSAEDRLPRARAAAGASDDDAGDVEEQRLGRPAAAGRPARARASTFSRKPWRSAKSSVSSTARWRSAVLAQAPPSPSSSSSGRRVALGVGLEHGCRGRRRP